MGHFRKNLITIFVTDRCNLRCRYCYDGAKAGNEGFKVISLDFAKAGISDFFRSTSSRAIRFFGGEPTLGFSAMVEITEFAQSLAGKLAGDGLYVEIQTNGVFEKPVADWLSRNADMAWVSCDGPPDIHDFYRPALNGKGSSTAVEETIRLLSKGPKTRVGVRATISPQNILRQREMSDYFASLGAKAISVYPLFAPVSGEQGQEKFKAEVGVVDPIAFADAYLSARRHAISMGIWYGSILTANFDERVNISCRAMLPAPQLTSDGYVSCCDMASGGDTKLQDLIYGFYEPHSKSIIYFPDKIARIRSRTVESLEECVGCEFIMNCAGGCLGEALNETGNMFRIKPYNCKITRYLAARLELNKGLSPVFNP